VIKARIEGAKAGWLEEQHGIRRREVELDEIGETTVVADHEQQTVAAGESRGRPPLDHLNLELDPSDLARVTLDLVRDGDTVGFSYSNSLRQLGIEVMEGAESEQSTEALLPLLDDNSDSIRAAAIDQLSKQMKPKGKRTMIDAYSRGGYYFYNVITRLDRGLYAPGWLRTAVARKS
jgi:hypothetical protein